MKSNSAIASGNYRYNLDGVEQPIEEPWQLIQTDSGLILQGRRIVNGIALLTVDARFKNGAWQQMSLHWAGNGAGDDPGQHYRLEYRLANNELAWAHAGKSEQRFALPDNTLLFPLLRAASGSLLSQLAAKPQTLVLPCLRDPQDQAAFLRPIMSQRRAEYVQQLDDDTTHFRYYGGEYGEAGSDYWLNRQGLLQRYVWQSPHGCWDVQLKDYQAPDTLPIFSAMGRSRPASAR